LFLFFFLLPSPSSLSTLSLHDALPIFIVFVKVAVVLLFIVFAAHAINPANWHPFIPAQTVKDGVPVAGEYGWSGVFTGAAIVFLDRKSTRLNSSHLGISYAVFCLKKKK